MILIRPAESDNWHDIWKMFHATVHQGESLVYESIDEEDAYSIWFGPDVKTFVAEDDGSIVGSYYLRPNFPGRGAHVANATYIVDEQNRGGGIGRMLGLHSIDMSAELGYSAIQFNCVVSTNKPAVRLWKSLGFHVVGTAPQAFEHPKHGTTDVLIMHRFCGRNVDQCEPVEATDSGLLDRLLHHDVWTTGQLLEHCDQLTDAQLDHEFDIGHRTIRATFHHIIHKMEVWSLLMSGDPVVRQHDRSRNALATRLGVAGQRLAKIGRSIAFRSVWNETWIDHLEDPPQAKSYGTSIAHVITHSMHHRAQLLYMMRQSGLENLPEADVFSAESGRQSVAETPES